MNNDINKNEIVDEYTEEAKKLGFTVSTEPFSFVTQTNHQRPKISKTE